MRWQLDRCRLLDVSRPDARFHARREQFERAATQPPAPFQRSRPDLEFADDVRLVFTNDDKPILRRLSRRTRQIAVEISRRPLIELQPSKRATCAESLGNFVMLLVAFRHGCLAARGPRGPHVRRYLMPFYSGKLPIRLRFCSRSSLYRRPRRGFATHR